MDPLHIVMLVVSVLLTASQFVATNFPQYAVAAHAAAGILSNILPFVVAKQATDAPAPAQLPLAPQVAAATQALDDELKRAASGGVPGANK